MAGFPGVGRRGLRLDVVVEGKVHLERKKDVLEGTDLRMNLENKKGELGQPNYFLKEGGGRGTGSLFVSEGEDYYRLKKGEYTTCPPIVSPM